QFDGHLIRVDAVDAAAHNIAQGMANGVGAGLVIAGADGGEAARDSVGSGDKEVARARGRIEHCQGKNPRLRSAHTDSLVEHWLESRVEQFGDEARRGVVAACGLALVTTSGLEVELAGGDVERWVELEKRFVHRAELFCSEVTEVHGAADVFTRILK